MGKVLNMVKKYSKKIEQMLKDMKNKITKKSKTMPQKTQGTKTPINYGAMIEEMVKKLPEKKDKKIVAFVKDYSPDLDKVGEKKEKEEPIYEEVPLEPTNDRDGVEGGYSVITKENMKPKEKEEPIYEGIYENADRGLINDHGVGEAGYSVITKENMKPKEKEGLIYDEVPREQPKNRWGGEGEYSVITKENMKPKNQGPQPHYADPKTKGPKYDQVTGANKPVIAPKPKLTKEFIEEMKEKSQRKNQQKKPNVPIYSKPKKER